MAQARHAHTGPWRGRRWRGWRASQVTSALLAYLCLACAHLLLVAGAGDVGGRDHGGAAPPPRRRLAPRGAPPPPVNARTRHAQGGEGGACRRRESTGDPGTRGEGDPGTRDEDGAPGRRQVRCRRQSACSFMSLRCRLPPGAPRGPPAPTVSLVSTWMSTVLLGVEVVPGVETVLDLLPRVDIVHAPPCGPAPRGASAPHCDAPSCPRPAVSRD